MAAVGGLSLLFLAGCGDTPMPASSAQAAPTDIPGLVVYTSHYDVATTITRLSDALRSAGGTVVATPEPATYGPGPGEPLPVAAVVVGGTRQTDVALVTANQRAAINLPQKFLVRASDSNGVEVAYNSAGYLAEVAGADSSAATGIGELSARVVSSATGSTQPTVRPAPQPAADTAPTAGPGADGYLTTVTSDADLNTTVSRLCDTARRQKLPWPTVLNMGTATGGQGGPTVVLVQNPAVTTQLVALSPWAAIDVPPRFVLWHNPQGQTMVSYPNVDQLAARYRVPANSAPVKALRDWFTSLTATVTGQHG
jgi:uncharacterized protein (DUF302 family)